MNNLIGQHLGPYRILEQIGSGGMATVYKAYQPAMERDVAIKVIAAHFAEEEEFRKRFRREAKAVARLEHAHILPVHDYGEADGRPYLVMRYLEAGTLKDRMAEGPLSLSDINRIVGQVGSALDYAHRMGVVHRDVKPANVLLDSEGDAYLTDFGLAKMMAGSAKLTGTGVGIGTPVYMSPEQGQAQKVDARSDVYSLGVMLYELATGRVPYEAETPLAVVLKHIQEPLPLPSSVRPEVPERVERVILRAMAKEPEDRYQAAGEMVRALDGAVRAADAASPTEPAIETTTPMPGVVRAAPRAKARKLRLPRWVGWAAGGAVALAAFFLILSRVPLRVQITGGQLEVVRVADEAAIPMPTPLPTVAPAVPNTPIPTEQAGATSVAATPAPGSPADQARAFAEPILAAIADRPPDYEDDFGDPGSGWPTGSDAADGDEWGYEDGAYSILAARGDGASPDGLSFSDFVLEVDVQFVSGEWGFWWVALRNSPGTLGQPANAEYGVGFSSDGSLYLWKNVARVHVDLLDHSVYAPSFKQGFEVNRVTIIAQGPQIAIYVNGEPLWFVYDESSSTGTISLEVANEIDDTPLRVHFDNLKVWDISDLPLSPAPLGRIVYADDRTGNEEIYVANSDGSSERRLTDHPARDDWSPTWSPDGTRIVFTSDRDAAHEDDYQLYVMDADGSNLTRLTHTDRNAKFASWSPDGSRIAFHSYCGLAVINADGSNWTTLMEGSEDLCVESPTWAPDSHQIAFRGMTPIEAPGPYQHDIYVVNDDGSGLLKLATFTSEERDWHVAWSPDGSQAAFGIILDGQQRYYAVSSDGSGDPVEISSIPDSWYPWYWPQWVGGEDAGTPIDADVLCWLQGPAGELASRNPHTGFDAIVQGRNAAQVVVESPSGEIVVLTPYGDIYGREGRFAGMTPGLPQAGGTYIFTALDTGGASIPGAVASSVYLGGYEPDPPSNIQAEVVETGILVTWDPSPAIPGGFEPNGSPPVGFYSIYLNREEGELAYGWNHEGRPLPETSCLIPFRRQDLGPGDTGLALEEMDDGVYYLELHAFSVAPEGTAGHYVECIAHDPAQNIRIVIEGGHVRIEGP